ncbi:MAG: hypothetical protein K1X56_05540 [Flavobacteriales bacterium]|nr:hypothetical protein [Flavobacteriales bacterium]
MASHRAALKKLEQIQRSFTKEDIIKCLQLFKELSPRKMEHGKEMIHYAELCLFTLAYPATRELFDLAEKRLKEIIAQVEQFGKKHKEQLYYNSGIPGSEICANFSLVHNEWLIEKFGEQAAWYSEGQNEAFIAGLLNFNLNPMEQEVMNASKSEWDVWSEEITGSKKSKHQLLRHVVQETRRLSLPLAAKEFIFSEFKTYTSWKTKSDAPTMFGARAPKSKRFIHSDGILKRMDISTALAQGVPKKISLSRSDKEKLIDLGKGTLAGLQRETDPITYAQVQETELFDMGRGISIALYYMQPEMKMSLQSYAGYMLFKNGVPCAYGGGWLLNKESGFGVNIFPPFRGGESANVVCQLLRLYALHFRADTFTVDPYQIGLDNPDGIQSGSFWFYYRLGFRPEQSSLFKLAESEFKKITSKKGYRSSEKILLQLAHSSMRWVHPARSDRKFISPDKCGDKVTAFINKNYQGNRSLALKNALEKIEAKCARKYSPHHSVAAIAVLADATGYIEKSSASELKAFLEVYAFKAKSELTYIHDVQSFPHFFEGLR